jgi:hypothetical protein
VRGRFSSIRSKSTGGASGAFLYRGTVRSLGRSPK